MSEFSFIADLPVADDLNVPVSQEDYLDQAGPSPVKPGNYRFTIPAGKVVARKDKAGNAVLQDNIYPTIVVQQVKLIEPTELERLVGVFTDVKFKPFNRKVGVKEQVASELWDFLRAFDEAQDIDDYDHAKQLLQQNLEQGTPFYGQISWTGYDKAYVEQEFAKLGVTTPEGRKSVDKEVANAIYAKARKNTKDFMVNGQLVPSIIGASGETVEAQPKLKFLPSGTEIGKGKDAKGRARIELGPFKK